MFDAFILAHIKAQVDGEFTYRGTDQEIAKVLNTSVSVVPNAISKLYKLGYIEVHHDNGTRIITYTYDAPHSLSNSGYVYIMVDENIPDVLKIGFSKNPAHREGTLQAEKPTIKLLGKWKGTISQEQTCHRILAKHRIRGEWFRIDVQTAEKTIKQVTGVI